MNHHSGAKSVVKATASVAASATHSHEIDTAGFKYASIDVIFSPFTASNVSLASVLKVAEGDTSGSTMTDIAAMVGGGAGGFTIAATGSSASVGGVARFNVDLRGRKRFLTVSVSPSTTVAVVTAARLSKAEQAGVTATETGVNNVVNV